MAIGDNRILIYDDKHQPYWYNPNTGELFIAKTSTEPIVGAVVDDRDGTFVVVSVNPPTVPKEGPLGTNAGTGDILPPNPPAGGIITPVAISPGEQEPTDPVDEGDAQARADLLAYIETILAPAGLNTPGILAFVTDAIAKGWKADRILLEIRKHPDYLADPIRAANAANGFLISEQDLVIMREEVKRIARENGYSEPSNAYIALLINDGPMVGKSIAEFEKRVLIQRRIDEFGEPVRQFAEQYLGVDMSDEDLFELFSDEHNTADFERAFKLAQYRGRPILLGFEGRSEEEALLYEQLGLSPDEVFARFGQARDIKSRTQKLALIEGELFGDLDREGVLSILKGHEDLVVRAAVGQTPEDQRKLQQLIVREAARWRRGGGAATSGAGLAVGLLAPDER